LCTKRSKSTLKASSFSPLSATDCRRYLFVSSLSLSLICNFFSEWQSGVQPLYSLLESTPLRLRDDLPADKLPSTEEILSNAKGKQDKYFSVPRIKDELD
jgi:Asp-tRNA(Asn)/Glu-tRNA(Gln) amidotransferase C subunit